MTDRTPVDGPFRIHVDPTPSGATLDMSHYLHTLLVALAHAADEDGESVLNDLVHIAELDRSAGVQGPDSHAGHERDERVSDLLDELVDGGRVPVYGVQVLRLADRLRDIGQPKGLPGQRGAA
ncbi:hypothetical protein OG897_06380 [Streptomyces sp. NBC_00237]|uniref:hypothetical protein n=1 Tax=Streptomyces sp. NBC_00237 TaxID=2975687 RepID=UPI00225B4855|nr:hypothetical protein [Streptomyces sp. NBC_00237]MCX5201089.1 hypothetical protein [Streptomyces sp. NBC_00237]